MCELIEDITARIQSCDLIIIHTTTFILIMRIESIFSRMSDIYHDQGAVMLVSKSISYIQCQTYLIYQDFIEYLRQLSSSEQKKNQSKWGYC